MRHLRSLVVLGLVLSAAGCGDAERERLRAENAELHKKLAAANQELEDLKSGPDKLLAAAQLDLREGRPRDAKDKLQRLKKLHPESEQAKAADDLEASAERAVTEAEKKAQAEREAAAAQQAKAAEAAEREKKAKVALATKSMKKDRDEVKSITWYRDRSSKKLGNFVQLYFGMSDAGVFTPLRLHMEFYGSDWIFFDSVTVKADDATFTLSGLRPERDNDGGYVWEWVDEPVDKKMMLMLEAIQKAKKVVVRFEGKYYKDLTLPAEQRTAIANVIAAYEALGGPKPD